MLKLKIKTLPFPPSLEHFQIVCGFESLWEFPFCAKYYDWDCSLKMITQKSNKQPFAWLIVKQIIADEKSLI